MLGICYTRTGRRFFEDAAIETELLKQVKETIDKADYWETLNTDWVCLDCELMPWSVKAQELLRQQYAPVGTSASVALGEAVAALETAAERGVEVGVILNDYRQRTAAVAEYIKAYQQYCWQVQSITDLKLAPFHLLATEGTVYFDKNHLWHMETLTKLCQNSEGNLLFATRYGPVDVTDDTSQAEAIHQWEELTEQGGEGMVIKPLNFIVQGKRGLVQPAVKCRGREYLRIIYGPEYTLSQNLDRLRSADSLTNVPSRFESSHWVLKRLSVSFTANRCPMFMNVFSESYHLRVRQSIQDFEVSSLKLTFVSKFFDANFRQLQQTL